MKTRSFLTVEINEPMLTTVAAAKFAAFSPNMAECARKFGHEYRMYNFGAWLTHILLKEVEEQLGRYFYRYMDECHHDEFRDAEEKDEEYFESLMWSACEKCKKVDSYTGYHGVCKRGKRLQCQSRLDAEKWVNSEHYKEVLEKIEGK